GGRRFVFALLRESLVRPGTQSPPTISRAPSVISQFLLSANRVIVFLLLIQYCPDTALLPGRWWTYFRSDAVRGPPVKAAPDVPSALPTKDGFLLPSPGEAESESIDCHAPRKFFCL